LLFGTRLGVPFQELNRGQAQTVFEPQEIVGRQHQIQICAAPRKAGDPLVTPEPEDLSIKGLKGRLRIHAGRLDIHFHVENHVLRAW
jgi:hypothetical protein